MVSRKTHDRNTGDTTGNHRRMMAKIRLGEVCAKCKDDSTCEECAFQSPAKNTPIVMQQVNQVTLDSSDQSREPRQQGGGGSYDCFKGF
jgi:hypothetical protein